MDRKRRGGHRRLRVGSMWAGDGAVECLLRMLEGEAAEGVEVDWEFC